jgi:hypothetical protein
MVPMIYTAPPAPGATVATVRAQGHRPSGMGPAFTVPSVSPPVFDEVIVLNGAPTC